MANRSFYNQQRSYARELIFVPFTISINASNAVTAIEDGEGAVPVAAARTAAGTYDLTFVDSFPKLVSATFAYEAATAIDRIIQISSVSLSTKVIQIKQLAGAVATDAGAVHKIHCIFVFSNV
jgi:hypothetical protein